MNRIPVKNLAPIKEVPLYVDLRELQRGCAERFGDKTAFKIKTKKETKSSPAEYRIVSYKQFLADTEDLGTGFMKRFGTGKRMAVIGKNRYDWVITYFAQVSGLGIIVPLDKDLPYQDLEFSIQKAKADILVFDDLHEELAKQLKESEAGKNLEFIAMDDLDGWVHMGDILAEGNAAPESEKEAYRQLPIDGKQVWTILFTSGTSGIAKAVMQSQYNITYDIYCTCMAENLLEGDVNMAFLPYHHTFGFTGQCVMLFTGAENVYCDGLKYVQKNLVEYKVSVFICVPLLIESIYKKVMAEIEKQGKMATFKKGIKISNFLLKFGIDIRKKLFGEILEKLGGGLRYIISGASPLDPVVARDFAAMGITVVQGYGMTETSPVIAAENEYTIEAGSIGKAIPGIEVAIDDPDSEGVGEIIVRGGIVMQGYYENQEATDEILEPDGWLHTGDLARISAKGNIFICGRKKSVIVLKNGKNVYPEELEILVGNLPYVQENMVFGEAREKDGDLKDLVLSVRIVYDPQRIAETRGASTMEEIEAAVKADIDAISAELPAYKQIYRRYLTTEPMEKTTTGKIKRYKQIQK